MEEHKKLAGANAYLLEEHKKLSDENTQLKDENTKISEENAKIVKEKENLALKCWNFTEGKITMLGKFRDLQEANKKLTEEIEPMKEKVKE